MLPRTYVPAGPTRRGNLRVLVRVLVLRCVAACCSLHVRDFATRHENVGGEIDQLHAEDVDLRIEVKRLNDALETVRAQAYQHPARVPHTCVHK